MIGTASAQARQGFIYTPHYAASKFGVAGLTQSLSRAVAGDGITPKKDQRLARIVPGWNVHKEVWSNYAECFDKLHRARP
jgi:NAD(P)-dependent dehydrogenase (short-subunit alcohol dehydrogenase family)